jgi:hypothetical protein
VNVFEQPQRDRKILTCTMANKADPEASNCCTMPSMGHQDSQDHIAPAGGFMSTTPNSTSRQPVLPSSGGLMGRSFTYRTAEQTDVRLTWERAKANLPRAKPQA